MPTDPTHHTLAHGTLDVFAAFGTMHLVTVLACFSAIALLVAIGRTLSTAAEWRLRIGLAVFALAVWTIYNIAWNWNGIDVVTGLPLHVCDLGQLIAPAALLTQIRWLRATLYFWAMALTTQAFIQPTVTQGPTSVLFWCFWIAHTIVLGYAVYDLAVLRFSPDWSDFRGAAAFSLGYFAFAFGLNVLIGSNYAYIGNPADPKLVPPFVLLLGPWPERALVMAGLAGLGFLVALLPWRLAAKPFPREAEADEVDEIAAKVG
ncbi:hypothetical protein A33M_2429 [Rhodovulum sp. PH10]|uniref:YwaF family protein n=1 Tax=Rhodovulum sp. PH10 TaxID=1187851 RepID=UPI00027C2C14|nr:TIGR02206 family membrane protein [Rhodovulum sp. PH10]EJW12091.1 hypothetical protein A33M_2429 [Rhodovulum sp. PH10]